MSIDLAAHFGATTRVVESIERDGRPAKAVIASRVFDTDPDDLWEAVTTSERLARWFAPVSGDLKLGGRYQIKGNAGGTITECVPPERLALTWEIFGAVSWVTVRVEPVAEGARLTVEHVAHVDAHWEKFGAGAGGVGWELGFLGLARFLSAPADAVRDEGMTWMPSPAASASHSRWPKSSVGW